MAFQSNQNITYMDLSRIRAVFAEYWQTILRTNTNRINLLRIESTLVAIRVKVVLVILVMSDSSA